MCDEGVESIDVLNSTYSRAEPCGCTFNHEHVARNQERQARNQERQLSSPTLTVTSIGKAFLVVGILMVMVGMSMSSTNTATASYCADPSPSGYCPPSASYQTTVESTNPAKVPTMALGLANALVGGYLLAFYEG